MAGSFCRIAFTAAGTCTAATTSATGTRAMFAFRTTAAGSAAFATAAACTFRTAAVTFTFSAQGFAFAVAFTVFSSIRPGFAA